MPHPAIKVVEAVCKDLDDGSIFSVGARAALRAMAAHWEDHLAEGHSPQIILDDIGEMKNKLEAMRVELLRRLPATLGTCVLP